MQPARLSLRLFLRDPSALETDSVVPLFHHWIRNRTVPGLLIDVADYRHVADGPGVVLVGHESDYRIDDRHGGRGLVHVDRPRASDEGWTERLQRLLTHALLACRALETDERAGGSRFRTDRMILSITDRLRVGSPDAATRLAETAGSRLASLVEPAGLRVAPLAQDPRRPAGIRLILDGAPSVEWLLDRLRPQATTSPAAPARIQLALERVREIERTARDGYPHEVCGLLIGDVRDDAARIQRVTVARNLEAQRTQDRFTLDPTDYLRADELAREQGLEIVGVWHTHPDHPARPSPTDLEWAWEGFSYVIASVDRAGVGPLRSWRLAGGHFEEQTIEEVGV